MTTAAKIRTSKPVHARLATVLCDIVDADAIHDGSGSRALMAADIWFGPAGDIALVVTPHSLDQLAAVMRAAYAVGVAIAPRGAGMSYSGSHVATVADNLCDGIPIVTLPLAVPAADEIVVRSNLAGMNGIFDNKFAAGRPAT